MEWLMVSQWDDLFYPFSSETLAMIQEHGMMMPNKTQFTTAEGAQQFSKPHIFEVHGLVSLN